MGLALDEPKTDDISHEISGIRFVVAKKEQPYILGRSGVLIDYREGFFGGFSISALGKALEGC